MERAYRQSTRVLGALLACLGVAIVVVTVAGGGGALALGVVLGAMLTAIGLGRFVLARGSSGRGPQ